MKSKDFLIIDLNNLYAPSIAMNEEKNRVLCGMFFFDMFHAEVVSYLLQ